MSLTSNVKGIDGIPELKKKPERVYVGAYFWWDFRRDWQPLVSIAKKHGLKFDSDLKKWKLSGPAVQYAIIRDLLKAGEPDKNINVFDFEDEALVPVSRWRQILLEQDTLHKTMIELPTVRNSFPSEMIIDTEGVRVKMPLKVNGKPKRFDDYLLYGLAVIGCEGKLHPKDGCYWLTAHTNLAVDYVVNHMPDVQIKGLPKFLPRPFIIDYFTDDQVFPHQKQGITFLYNRKCALLADDMGLGKTMQSIIAAEQIKADGEAKRLIIVCPLTLIANWRRELKMWGSSFNDVTIVPYSQVHKVEKIPPESIVILDESHALKRCESRRTQSMINLVSSNEKNISRLWFLTGTPVTKDNGDLWAMAMMMKHNLANEFTPLRLAAQNGENNALVSGALKTHMLLRKKEDCLNLPEKLRQTIDVDTELQADMEILKKGDRKAIMEHLMKLKRLSAEVKADATVEFLQDFLESGKKVVVFSEHTAALHKIHEAFNGRSVLLDGTTKPSERDTLVQRFQSDDSCRVFCGNIKAAGVGITLTAASHVVFNDLTWLPSDVYQSENRLHRIGQKFMVNVYYITDPKLIIDNIILRILGNRSTEIASFEGIEDTVLEEVRRWCDANGGG